MNKTLGAIFGLITSAAVALTPTAMANQLQLKNEFVSALSLGVGPDFGVNFSYHRSLLDWFSLGPRVQFHAIFGSDPAGWSAEFLVDPTFQYPLSSRATFFGGPSIGIGAFIGGDTDGSDATGLSKLVGARIGGLFLISTRLAIRPELEYLRLFLSDPNKDFDLNLFRFNVGLSFFF